MTISSLSSDEDDKVNLVGDTSRIRDDSDSSEVSTNDETAPESEIDPERRDYWIWEKGEVALLDREGHEKGERARDRQAEKFSENVPEEDEEEEAVERVVGPLRRVITAKQDDEEEEENGDNVAA